MIKLKSKEEIEIMKKGGKIIAGILAGLSAEVQPGVSIKDLDDKARELCAKHNVTPVFLGYKPSGAARPFPAALCVSINEQIVHGIPNEADKEGNFRTLKEGDIVSLDMGITHEGLILDSAITVPVGKVDERALELMNATKDALFAGITMAKEGGRIGDIGAAIEKVAQMHNFTLAEDLCGHGVGYAVHEDPFVPNIGVAGTGQVLKEGLVIAIEPMLCEKGSGIKVLKDGYTIVTRDGGRAAHFEHTIAITKDGPVILSAR